MRRNTYLLTTAIFFLLTFTCQAQRWGKHKIVTPPQLEIRQDTTEIDASEALMISEEMPVYPGGQQAMYDFINTNLKYPDEAKEKDITGKVFVQFIVTKKGELRNAKILKDIGGGCGWECVRVVRTMPNWIPGRQGGKAVLVIVRIPFNFKLDK